MSLKDFNEVRKQAIIYLNENLKEIFIDHFISPRGKKSLR